MSKKIYTRTGDDGTTNIFGGKRLPKYDLHIEVLGTFDELNAFLGIARSFTPFPDIDNLLHKIQQDIFVAGCTISVPNDPSPSLPNLTESDVLVLEQYIDKYDADLPPLRAFILPAGSPSAAYLHAARTICRRAERALALLATKEELNPVFLKYFNRCSDLLFVLARLANVRTHTNDEEWHP